MLPRIVCGGVFDALDCDQGWRGAKGANSDLPLPCWGGFLSGSRAPIPFDDRRRLEIDAADVRATADRKGVVLDRFEELLEGVAARNHFELGCWLFYYGRLIEQSGADGLAARAACADLLLQSGFRNPSLFFNTVFDFGQYRFDLVAKERSNHGVQLELVAA